MADFAYNYVASYSVNIATNTASIVSSGIVGSDGTQQETATDTEVGSQFEAGDTITFPPFLGESSGAYLGTIVLTVTYTSTFFPENVTFVVVEIAPGQIYLIGNVNPGTNTTTVFADTPATFDTTTIDTDPFTVCFAAGTLIATPTGPRQVETLSIGDQVLTADGRSVPVRWVGRQTVHKLFTPEMRFRPVRLTAGSLGHGLPTTDLVVTADHALAIGGLLVQAGALVDNRTIVRVALEELADIVTYFHVETTDHDLIVAAGVPAETFVDNVTRRRFDNYAEYVALYGDTSPTIAEMETPRVKSARQLPAALRAGLMSGAVAA